MTSHVAFSLNFTGLIVSQDTEKKKTQRPTEIYTQIFKKLDIYIYVISRGHQKVMDMQDTFVAAISDSHSY